MTKRRSLKIPSAEDQEAMAAINLWSERDGGAWLARRARAGLTSKAELELFASMAEGTAKQRRPKSRVERWSVRLAIAKSVALLERRMQRKAAVPIVANYFGVSNRTVETVLSEFARK